LGLTLLFVNQNRKKAGYSIFAHSRSFRSPRILPHPSHIPPWQGGMKGGLTIGKIIRSNTMPRLLSSLNLSKNIVGAKVRLPGMNNQLYYFTISAVKVYNFASFHASFGNPAFAHTCSRKVSLFHPNSDATCGRRRPLCMPFTIKRPCLPT
jgi:hypothetical protein